ncbi:MAG: phenylalanine--tRNA ligase subunit beta [candidate division Zixibacteria bacterium]
MKISFNLLQTLIHFDWSTEELADKLTMSGSEVEAIEVKGAEIEGIIAAEVTVAEKAPGSKKLSLCKVFDGQSEYQVICGAPNVAAGQIILFAPVGSRIPGMKLEKAVIHGHESYGMILSEAELGLTENADEITVLSSVIKPGTRLGNIIDFKDTIYELEITPNRPDCLSHLGIAREIQALGGGKIITPDISLVEIDDSAADAVKITIDDPIGCPRYTGRVIQGVKIGQSPLWLKMIVYYLGMRPINNVVDITNYVMLELGHPLHAFDYDLFSCPEVKIRRAVNDEKFVTLDGVERKLIDQHLLITDGDIGVAIAGIMGGEKSEVSQGTDNLLLESAYFDPAIIRKGSKNLDLATESSRRFERGADPNMAPVANDRACKLISELTGGRVLKGMVDTYPKKSVPVSIELRPARANKLLGTDISLEKITEILRNLDIEISVGESVVALQPSFRPDLTREVDLIEEVARIYGLDNIPSKFRPGGSLITPETSLLSISGKTRSYLSGLGAMEIFPLTLVDSKMTEKFGLADSAVKIMNPLSEEMAVVRPNLILSMLSVVRRNINYKENDLFLFEIGNYYSLSADGKLPEQKTALIIAQTGLESPIFWDSKPRARDLFSLKGAIENLADFLNLGNVELRPASHFAFEQTRSFEVYINNIAVGYIGKLSKKGGSIADIKTDVFMAELDFDIIVRMVPQSLEAIQLARFPSADRDIAIVVADSVKSDDIKKTITESGGGLVDEVWIFDLYKGKNIDKGKKSLAFGIKYRRPDRTLTDEEVDEMHKKISGALEEEHGATLRS